MRTFFLFILLTAFSVSVSAQLSLGVKAGVNLADADISGDSTAFDALGITAVLAGAIVEVGFGKHFSVQAEANFMGKGWGTDETIPGLPGAEPTTIKGETKFNYLDVPVLLKYKTGGENAGIYIAAGPTFGYALGGSYDITTKSPIINFTNKGDIDWSDPQWNDFERFELGASFGGGIYFRIGPGNLFVDGRYLLGFTDVSGSSDSEDSIRHRGIGLSGGYVITF